MAKKIRVGVIAAGRIGRAHGHGWRECEHTEIVAVADSHPQALSVERKTDHYIFGHRVEDRCAGIIGYPDGVEGLIENELGDWGGINCTVYGTDGIMEINDNSLKYLSPGQAGWQEFTPTEKEIGGYGRSHVDQAYAICEWIRIVDLTTFPFRGVDS